MARRFLPLALILLLWLPSAGFAQADRYVGDGGKIRVAVVKQPVKGSRNVPELSENPDYIEAGGLASRLDAMGVTLKPTATARLTAEEQGDYGEWHRLGLANGHLGDLVAANEREGYFTVGLLANCSSLSGVLAGLQHSGPTRRPLRVGLVFIDAHGDYNTPETTLSGMLGGMPVAVAAGHALTNVRLESGLNPALPTSYIVMSCVRDTDPLEQERIQSALKGEGGHGGSAGRERRHLRSVLVVVELQIDVSGLQRRDETEREANDDRDADCDGQHPAVDPGVHDPGDYGRRHLQEEAQAYLSDRHACRGGDQREQEALDEKLSRQPRRARSERGPHGDFPAPRRAAREQEIRDVGASDQQHERDGAQQDEQGWTNRSEDDRLERLDERAATVVFRIVAFEVGRNGGQFLLRRERAGVAGEPADHQDRVGRSRIVLFRCLQRHPDVHVRARAAVGERSRVSGCRENLEDAEPVAAH